MYFSSQIRAPHCESEEVLLFFASESDGHTSWGVLLPTKSCQAGERYAVEDVGMYMHWALGDSHDFGYHTSRGQFHTNLVAGPPAPPPDMSAYDAVLLTMPEVPVVLGEGGSDAKNPYICGIFDMDQVLPNMRIASEKHHAASFAPILDSASKEFLNLVWGTAPFLPMLSICCTLEIQHNGG